MGFSNRCLYNLGYMDGLTGGIVDDKYQLSFLATIYLAGYGDGLKIRKSFYKPDLYS